MSDYIKEDNNCSVRSRSVKQERFGTKPCCESDRKAVRSKWFITDPVITDSMHLEKDGVKMTGR